ncbi:hypothetical protein PUN28_019563 [Cardiocondyla obscurior]|uniref:Transmembrane protein n=1 Tax=Cardiocondyla obscurior TaxID=286306 RepID=A0AAW2EBX1_9HYME
MSRGNDDGLEHLSDSASRIDLTIPSRVCSRAFHDIACVRACAATVKNKKIFYPNSGRLRGIIFHYNVTCTKKRVSVVRSRTRVIHRSPCVVPFFSLFYFCLLTWLH